jgi:hypothetical protein
MFPKMVYHFLINYGNCKTSAPRKIMGKSNTQSIEVKRFKNMINPLSGAPPPPLGHPPCDSAVLPVLVPSLIAPRPPRGTGGAKKGATRTPENAFLQTKNIHFSPYWGLIVDNHLNYFLKIWAVTIGSTRITPVPGL